VCSGLGGLLGFGLALAFWQGETVRQTLENAVLAGAAGGFVGAFIACRISIGGVVAAGLNMRKVGRAFSALLLGSAIALGGSVVLHEMEAPEIWLVLFGAFVTAPTVAVFVPELLAVRAGYRRRIPRANTRGNGGSGYSSVEISLEYMYEAYEAYLASSMSRRTSVLRLVVFLLLPIAASAVVPLKLGFSGRDWWQIALTIVLSVAQVALLTAALREIFHGRLPGNMDPMDAGGFRGHFLKEILLSGSCKQWPGGGSRSPQTAGSPCNIPQETSPGSTCSSLGTLRHEQSVSVKVRISA